RAVTLVRDHVQQAVRTLAHVANAPAPILQQRLAAQLFEVLVHDDALELARGRDLAVAHAADEEIALPARKAIARVERHARDRDRRYPRHDGVDHALAMELVGLERSRV